MNTSTKPNAVVVNEVSFVRTSGDVYEASINDKNLCGIVYKVGNQWYYSRNTGKVTTKGGFTSYTEAMQALTS